MISQFTDRILRYTPFSRRRASKRAQETRKVKFARHLKPRLEEENATTSDVVTGTKRPRSPTLSSDTDTDSSTDRIIDNRPKKKCKIGLLHELAVPEANLDFPVADGSTERVAAPDTHARSGTIELGESVHEMTAGAVDNTRPTSESGFNFAMETSALPGAVSRESPPPAVSDANSLLPQLSGRNVEPADQSGTPGSHEHEPISQAPLEDMPGSPDVISGDPSTSGSPTCTQQSDHPGDVVVSETFLPTEQGSCMGRRVEEDHSDAGCMAVSAGPDAINETPSEFILSHEQPYSGGSVGLLLGHQLDETNVQGLEGVEFNVQQHEYSGPGNVLPSKLEIHVEERPAERDGLGIDDVILSSRSEVVGGISTSSTSTNLTPAKPLGGSARPLDRLLLGHGDATIGRNSLDSVALNVQNDGLDDIRPSDTSPPSQLVTRVDECAEGRDPGRDDVRCFSDGPNTEGEAPSMNDNPCDTNFMSVPPGPSYDHELDDTSSRRNEVVVQKLLDDVTSLPSERCSPMEQCIAGDDSGEENMVVDAIIGAPLAPGPLSYFDFAPPVSLGGELGLAEIRQPGVASGDGNEDNDRSCPSRGMAASPVDGTSSVAIIRFTDDAVSEQRGCDGRLVSASPTFTIVPDLSSNRPDFEPLQSTASADMSPCPVADGPSHANQVAVPTVPLSEHPRPNFTPTPLDQLRIMHGFEQHSIDRPGDFRGPHLLRTPTPVASDLCIQSTSVDISVLNQLQTAAHSPRRNTPSTSTFNAVSVTPSPPFSPDKLRELESFQRHSVQDEAISSGYNEHDNDWDMENGGDDRDPEEGYNADYEDEDQDIERSQGTYTGFRDYDDANARENEGSHGDDSNGQRRTDVSMDIGLQQLLEGDENQSATRGDLVVLTSAMIDLRDAILTLRRVEQPTMASSPHPTAEEITASGPISVESPRGYQPRHRFSGRLTLQESVQQHAVHMLGRESRRHPFPKVASVQETNLYAATGRGGPTTEDFRLDFHGPPASEWNQCATEVFASDFTECGWYGSPSKGDVKKAFRTHMRTLRTQYARLHAEVPPDDEQMQIQRDEEQAKARDQRRRSLRHRRENACLVHPDLSRFKPLWKTLPHDVMSGDETDQQPGQHRYAVMRLNWRSQAATEWLRVFDLVHLSSRFNSNGRAKRGAFPHVRIPSRRAELPSQVVPRLPSNFYDETWLLTLDDHAKAKLYMLPEVDLSHTSAVLRLADKYKNVKGRKLGESGADTVA